MSVWTRCLTLSAAAIVAAVIAGPASAQTKLKWAHVYEISEPYHTQALWAADEIKKRTNGKYEIQVFPASQLGNENQINEGLGLGTVDMIYTGTSFAGSIHKPLAISGAPFMLLHCNSTYPAPFKDINLKYMDRLRSAGECPVGYSSHDRGINVAVAAVTLGASIIEKHFTLDRT